MPGKVRAHGGGHMKSWILPALLVAAVSPASAEEFAGAGRAVDGDSLFVGGREVRLFGIDAPEYRQTCRVNWSSWSCGSDAAAALRAMVDARQLTCSSRDRDVYGRTVASCRAGGVDLAAAMLEKGLAIALDNAPASYAALADHSKAQRAGIWGSEFDVPAVYRAANPRNSGPRVVSATVARPVAARPVASGVFHNCAEARATGAAPVRRGQPGYNPQLDGDNDGIACEPYRRR